MIIASDIDKKNWKWLLAYVATFFLPFALIFSRAAADVCCVIIGILFLWQSYENKKWDWLNSPFIKVGLLAWLWLMLVVSPFAIIPKESLSVAAPWIRYILLFAALRYWVLVKPESIFLLGKILATMLAFVMVDTIWQYVYGVSLSGNLRYESGRLTGPLDNVKVGIFIAKILLPAIGICLFFSLRDKRHLWMIFAILLFVVSETVILLSGERTAFISSVIGLISVVVLLAMAERRVRVIAPFIVVFFTAIFFYLVKTQDWVLLRFIELKDTIFTFADSAYGKLFNAAYIIGENNWLNGAGLKGFRILSSAIEDKKNPYCNGDYCNLHPHNTYLEWFSEAGVVGLLFYSVMVIILFVTALRCFKMSGGIYRLLPAIAFGTVFINFFPLMVTQSIFSNWPAILLWYSVAVSFAALNLCKNSTSVGKY